MPARQQQPLPARQQQRLQKTASSVSPSACGMRCRSGSRQRRQRWKASCPRGRACRALVESLERTCGCLTAACLPRKVGVWGRPHPSAELVLCFMECSAALWQDMIEQDASSGL